MKKQFLLFLAFMTNLSLLAAPVEVDGIYYNLSGDSAEVTYKQSFKYSGNVIIPSTITYNQQTYRVTSIGDNSFRSCKTLDTVIISQGVIIIGTSAFESCDSLRYVYIPNGVRSIGKYAFWYCELLTSIIIPESVDSIGDAAFIHCTSLPIENNIRYADTYLVEALDNTQKSYSIKKGTRWIGSNAFNYCSNLSSIDIPDEVKYIQNNAFAGCGSLCTVNLSNSVTYIGEGAFSSTSLDTIIIPSNVDYIGSGAYSGCYKPISVHIPNSVTTIEGYAFLGVNNLIYNGIATYDEQNPFWGAKSLNGHVDGYLVYEDTSKTILRGCAANAKGAIILPNSVNKINRSAFEGCYLLSSISIPDGITKIEDYTFSGCGITTFNIPNSVSEIGKSAFNSCQKLDSINIPNTVQKIGTYCFGGCISLQAIHLPMQLTVIDTGLLANCSKLSSINIPKSTEKINFVAFQWCSSLDSIVLPNSLSYLGESAFRLCTKLKKVEMGNKLSKIEMDAFACDSALTTILFPDSLIYIGFNAFMNCISLEKICFPSKLEELGMQSFANCIGLKSIVFPTNMHKIWYTVFSNCTALKSITCLANTPPICYSTSFNGVDKSIPVFVPSDSINVYRAAGGWKEFTNILPITDPYGKCGNSLFWTYNEGILSITGNGEMYDFAPNRSPWAYFKDSINLIVINDDATSIGENAFNGFDHVSSMVIGKQITDIGDSAFTNCKNLKYIQWNAINGPTCSLGSQVDTIGFGNSVREIPDSLCLNLNKLSSLAIPNSVVTIGKKAFYGISNKKFNTLSIPNSVILIKQSAFANCAYLKSIYLGISIEEIEDSAFAYNDRLYYVSCYAANPPILQESAFPNYDIYLEVPCSAINEYKVAKGWKLFNKDNISCSSPANVDETFFSSKEGQGEASKFIKDGQFYILRDGKTYNAQGGEL